MAGNRGRTAAIVAGSALLLAVLVTGLFWKEIARGYHLRRLRSRPDLLLEYIEAPEGSVRKSVLRDFTSLPEGKQGFVEVFERIVVERLGFPGNGTLAEEKGLIRLLCGMGEQGAWIHVRRLHYPAAATDDSEMSITALDTDKRVVLQALKDVVPLFEDEDFVLPAYPHARWRFVPWREIQAQLDADRARGLPPLLLGAPKIAPLQPDDIFCVLEPRGEDAAATLASALGDPQTRYYAARTLGEMGSDARLTLPALRKAVEDARDEPERPQESSWRSARLFRETATEAIRKIEAPRAAK